MKSIRTQRSVRFLVLAGAVAAAMGSPGAAPPRPAAATAAASDESAARPGPRLTIYSQDFALVNETRTLDLRQGENPVRIPGVAALLEADSVVLRDPRRPDGVRLLDQRLLAEPLSRGRLLKESEGKVIQFLVQRQGARDEIVSGRVVRSGWVPPEARGRGLETEPIVEVDGKVRFSLPGEPLFEALPPGALAGPALVWNVWSETAGAREVEISYLTTGLGWSATYNLLLPETGEKGDLAAWVTITNGSGTDFADARLALMAGDVARARPQPKRMQEMDVMARGMIAAAPEAPISGQAFDEFHLYTLRRRATLESGASRQVEFARAAGVPVRRLYIYDGAQVSPYGYGGDQAITAPEYGAGGATRVAAVLELKNDEASGLGMPLPRGTVKVYRALAAGGREFVGENAIDHTPAGREVRVATGNAFDITAERRQTDFRTERRTVDEAFAITLRNARKEAVEVRVVERLYRWSEWKIVESSDPFTKVDARTVEFKARVPAAGEKTVTYRVHYAW